MLMVIEGIPQSLRLRKTRRITGKQIWGLVSEVASYFNQEDIRYLDGHFPDSRGTPFSDPWHIIHLFNFFMSYAVIPPRHFGI